MAQFFRMAMFDILPALRDLPADVRLNFHHAARFLPIGDASRQRYEFARAVVIEHEIKDFGLPDDQVNDGRVFLGCTPLDDKGVRAEIMRAETEARAMISSGATDSLGSCDAARQPTDEAKCCGVTRVAWEVILVGKRRQFPGASRVANLAAAAHYMLAKWHVCAAQASRRQMNIVIDGYDVKKRQLIGSGDKDLKSLAITPGNPPFPPDFAIRNWAYQGSDDGERDWLICNRNASRPLLFPNVTGKEY